MRYSKLGKTGIEVSTRKTIYKGKPSYFLKIGDQSYTIESQVELSQEYGISIPSRADFVFWPARAKEHIKPIVVFTDGYTYHKKRIDVDMATSSSNFVQRNWGSSIAARDSILWLRLKNSPIVETSETRLETGSRDDSNRNWKKWLKQIRCGLTI